MKKISLIILVVLLIILSVLVFNYIRFQLPMNSVIKEDYRNEGIKVSAHLLYYVSIGHLNYNLKNFSSTNSMADIFRVLLQYAEKMKDNEFDEVILSYKGKEKFKLNGNYFKTLGKEYGFQNSVYTARTFPENVLNMDGTKAFPTWTGGWLGVAGKQMEDFNEFHKKWYLYDVLN